MDRWATAVTKVVIQSLRGKEGDLGINQKKDRDRLFKEKGRPRKGGTKV